MFTRGRCFFCAQNHARYNSQKKKKRGTNNYDVFKNAFLTNWWIKNLIKFDELSAFRLLK